ncbi:hypothetical protein CWE09_00950 [Aliidiomarina minuta]|uniref:Invasion protein n=1 Tax=Aliidiomarina minuta TaxID=880057 RepID=A0A432W5I9_9GAMM|nr:SirB2 family protein [Aliidiomarina minuta]RUO25335.1 hypothetical protein CWE09_00950 [Aliidiomarina minuta]
MFAVFKHFHMTMAILSMVFLVVRFIMGMRNPAALNKPFLKIPPHIVDTLFVISIIAMIITVNITVYPSGWIGEKAALFITYIVFSVITVLAVRGKMPSKLRIPAFVLALVSWIWAIKIAFMKTPLLLG